MPDYQRRCEVLERENDDLRDRIALLEEMLGVTFESPPFMQLTPSEGKLFGLFMARDAVTKSLVLDAFYGDRPDADLAEEKIVDVYVCKLRDKLKRFGIEVETNWGQGYFMTAIMKKRAQDLIDENKSAAA